MRPPELRKVKSKKREGLLLAKKLKKQKEGGVSMARKSMLDSERDRVIEEYRKMKGKGMLNKVSL